VNAEEPTGAPSRRTRSWLVAGVVVAVIASLGALGLTIHNTTRLDDRVQDYVASRW
jgi:hypothetical protein